LFHFNRAYAQALRLAADVDEQRVFHELIGGVLDELKLHSAACEKWGVDLDAVEVHAASRAYVEFLESLHGKSSLELVAGMIPCMRLYAYVGRYFLTRADAGVDGIPDPRTSPYAEWFEAYGGDEMESLACRLESLLPEEIEDERAVDNYVPGSGLANARALRASCLVYRRIATDVVRLGNFSGPASFQVAFFDALASLKSYE
jgi:thiaminase